MPNKRAQQWSNTVICGLGWLVIFKSHISWRKLSQRKLKRKVRKAAKRVTGRVVIKVVIKKIGYPKELKGRGHSIN